MTEKRLQGHLDFFVRNLAYSLPEGRLAVLDMLHAIVTKFPQPVADGFAEYLLLPLTVRLAGDPHRDLAVLPEGPRAAWPPARWN
jgi:U3 small nucleolar RNA-associated protein 20